MSLAWWQTGSIYQIYPRSFQDTNGDGVGDLAGVRRRLDYLVWLGIDAIWLSPFYRSPMRDFGYDVADYCDVDPLFGTLADFDALVVQAHARNMKIILDFVPNHTSVAHPWFQASRRSRDDPKRNWYIWRDPAPDGGPPNNWVSHFGGSGWSFDAASGQYYYHAFLEEQPDLNWRNPEVVAAMHDVLLFWLKRGVDGFRIDVVSHLVEDAAFRDNPPNPSWKEVDPDILRFAQTHSSDQPETQDIIAGFRRVVDAFDERALIGELYLPVERVVAYYGAELRGLHLPFNFQLLDAPWSASDIGRIVDRYEAALPKGAWPNWVLSNHDRPRIAARVGEAAARIAAMLLLTLRGTPTLYYGDEIGLGHVDIPPERVQDTWALREPKAGAVRDPSRTPMQWDASSFAGFSVCEPWLPLSADHVERNVAAMQGDETSPLTLVRRLLHLRRARASLDRGAWRLYSADADVLLYERAQDAERTLVALNFAHDARSAPIPDAGLRILLSTHGDRAGEPLRARVALRPDEGVVIAPV